MYKRTEKKKINLVFSVSVTTTTAKAVITAIVTAIVTAIIKAIITAIFTASITMWNGEGEEDFPVVAEVPGSRRTGVNYNSERGYIYHKQKTL